MRVFKRFLPGTLFIALSSAASAVVLEQAPFGGGDGSRSMAPNMGAQVAEDFQFANDVSLTNISWWGSYDGDPLATEDFIVRIFEDNGSGDPKVASLLETGFSGNGDSGDGFSDLYGGIVYRYDITLASALALAGGVDYYLSVYINDDIGSPADWYWLESASGDNIGWSRASDADGWTPDNNDPQNGIIVNMSYRLTADEVAAVPEPAPLLLMGLPMLWFGRRLVLKRN